MNSMIEVRDVSVRFRMANDKINSLKEYMIQKLRGQLKYNEFKALSHVSFEVERGEVVGLVGHNGAGKSTLLKVISGILKPSEGSKLKDRYRRRSKSGVLKILAVGPIAPYVKHL